MLEFEGEDQDSSGAGSSASANRNNYMAQYEAAQAGRTRSDFGGDSSARPNRSKVQSRGRVQIKGQNKTKKWGVVEPLTNGSSGVNVSNNLPTGMSPDMPLAKNNRATAQLAPLNHFSPGLVG